jgi:glucokinase
MIIVSGAPGTGKSTVARLLADELALPLLSLDHLKETLADALGTGDEGWSNRLGDAAAEILFRLAPTFPAVIVEGWWRGERRTRAEREFRGWLQVFCRCEPSLAEARMRARHGRGRHPIHRDVLNVAVVDEAPELARTVTPLDNAGPLLQVDTREPAQPSRLADAVRAVVGYR